MNFVFIKSIRFYFQEQTKKPTGISGGGVFGIVAACLVVLIGLVFGGAYVLARRNVIPSTFPLFCRFNTKSDALLTGMETMNYSNKQENVAMSPSSVKNPNFE